MTSNSTGSRAEPVITVVDYGVGNIGALLNMFEHLGIEARASGDSREIATADKLVLPGVGAFDRAMSALRRRGLVSALEETVLNRRCPVLGVCLGMQLLARRSEEGSEPGLGWIEADVLRIRPPAGSDLKVPHIGWMEVHPVGTGALFGIKSERFYFDHSYFVSCDRADDVVAVIDYGSELCCAVSFRNVHGVQFHPEKSHRFGMRLLRSFADLRE
jgi:glutamine amidotransferase